MASETPRLARRRSPAPPVIRISRRRRRLALRPGGPPGFEIAPGAVRPTARRGGGLFGSVADRTRLAGQLRPRRLGGFDPAPGVARTPRRPQHRLDRHDLPIHPGDLRDELDSPMGRVRDPLLPRRRGRPLHLAARASGELAGAGRGGLDSVSRLRVPGPAGPVPDLVLRPGRLRPRGDARARAPHYEGGRARRGAAHVFAHLQRPRALAFTVGCAILLAFDRGDRRRLWVTAVPVVLFALWYLGWGHTDPQSHRSWANLADSPTFILDGFASAVAALAGVATQRDEADLAAGLGPPVAFPARCLRRRACDPCPAGSSGAVGGPRRRPDVLVPRRTQRRRVPSADLLALHVPGCDLCADDRRRALTRRATRSLGIDRRVRHPRPHGREQPRRPARGVRPAFGRRRR